MSDAYEMSFETVLLRLEAKRQHGSKGDQRVNLAVRRVLKAQRARIEFLEHTALQMQKDHAARGEELAALERQHAELTRRYDLLMQRTRE